MGIRGYMREYMRGYTRVWVGMRECAAVCAGIRKYMREYAAVCVGIREYMHEYAYAGMRSSALSDTVRKPFCLSGAVTWGKQQML